jgi:putative molybdopterin biosynthesis protein
MKPPLNSRVENQLAERRKSRGLGASDLARRVDVSRQTIYAIETGAYVPNTEVALKLARELDVTVDELFSLQEGSRDTPDTIAADVLCASPPPIGQSVRICRLGSRWIAVPVSASPYYIPDADGIVKAHAGHGRTGGRADLLAFGKEDAAHKRLVLAGCDPAMGLLSRIVEKTAGVEIVAAAASSTLALGWLSEGKVHIAGCHLEDPKTGEFNLPYIRDEFPAGEFSVVTFARWEQGLVIASGNPKRIRAIADLASRRLKFVNREPGSGSRALLDKLLKKAGMRRRQVHGYDRIADGHLAAAYCVLSCDADACLATCSAARAFGLDFIPLQRERYDLVMRKRPEDVPALKSFLDVLQRAALRRKLELVAGYDTAETGKLVA